MKASELVYLLQKEVAERGDKVVLFFHFSGEYDEENVWADIDSVETVVEDNEEIIQLS